MSQHVDTNVKFDQSAQYMADIQVVSKKITDLTWNIWLFFECIQNPGL